MQGLNSDGGERNAASGMTSLLSHALAAEEKGSTEKADVSSSPKESIPPWLVMAIMSTARTIGATANFNPVEADGGCSNTGEDLTFAAGQAELREVLERRVTESLRSLDSVRTLLEDPASSARQQGADRGKARWAGDEASAKLASLTAGADPAISLFEGALREWLAVRQGEGGGERHTVGGPKTCYKKAVYSEVAGKERLLGLKGSMPSPNDALALAFQCEAAGDDEAQASCLDAERFYCFLGLRLVPV